MNRLSVIVVAIAMLATAVVLSGCGEQEPQEATPTPAAETAAQEQPITQETCPVMGGEIDKDIYVDYQGRRIYFCCPGCPEEFQKDPEKYIEKL